MPPLFRRTFLLAGAVAAVVAVLAPTSASAYQTTTYEGIDGARGFIETPFLTATNNAMVLLPADPNPYPVSNPALPDPEQELTFPVRSISGSGEFFLRLRQYVAVNPRGIAEGVIVLAVYQRTAAPTEGGFIITDTLVIEERIRVKGRARFQFRTNVTIDGLEPWRDPALNSRVDVTENWNHRYMVQGKGRDDRGRDPVLAELLADLMDAEDIDDLESTPAADRLNRVRVNIATSNITTYFVDTAAESQRAESALRNGRRNFQPTGPIDVVFDGRRLRRSKGGVDVREGTLSEVAMFYDVSNFAATRTPAEDNGRVVAETNAGVVSELLESALGELVDLGGQGKVRVTAARDRSDRRVPGRLNLNGCNRVDKGVNYRVVLNGYVFDLADVIIALFQNPASTPSGEKPANYLDVHQLDLEPRNQTFSNPQILDRTLIRFSGRQHVPIPATPPPPA